MNYIVNKVVLISGASSGIGREFAVQVSKHAKEVIVLARREDRLKELEAELKCATRILVADLKLAKKNETHLGLKEVSEFIANNHIDILVNNAGLGSFGYFEELEEHQDLDIIDVNVVATTKLAYSVIPQMKARKSGAIINVSSVAAFQPIPLMTTYAASKVFNYFQAQGLRAELKEFGVRVLALCPGPVETEFGGVARVPGTATGGSRISVEKVVSDTLGALQKNRSFVIPGISAKFLALSASIFPKFISSKIVLKLLLPALRKSDKNEK